MEREGEERRREGERGKLCDAASEASSRAPC